MVRTYTPNSPHYPHSLSCTLPPLPSSTLSSGLSYTASYPASTFILSQTIATDLSLSTLSHSHIHTLTHTHSLSLTHTHSTTHLHEMKCIAHLISSTPLRSVLYLHMSLPLSCATPHRQKKLADEMKAAGPMLGGDSKVGVTLTE